MFFGKILAQGQKYSFNAAEAEETQGEVLSLTNVVLAPTANNNPASLWIEKEGQ